MAPANEHIQSNRPVPALQIIYRIALGNAVPQLQRGLGHGLWEFGPCSLCNYMPGTIVYTAAGVYI